MSNSVSIYLNYFGPAKVIKTEVLLPIQVGRANTKNILPMIGDASGENISSKNSTYCELTGQYWAWKNDKTSEYIGFMHYRRFFDFFPEEKDRDVNEFGIVVEDCITEEMLSRYGLNDERIRECVDDVDMILPEPWQILGGLSIYQQYKSAEFHHVGDLEAAGDIIKSISPDYYQDYKKVMASKSGFFTNMFVFKRELFEEYSAWLFAILEALESAIDTTNYNAVERRVIGYISERLLGVFVENKLRHNPGLRVRYLRRVFVNNTKPPVSCPDVPKTDLPVVSVAASTDSNYVPHMAALLASVLSNASKSSFIDFLILDGGMNDVDRHGLRALESLHPNAKISFIDMSGDFLDVSVHDYFTRATFYRLALPEIVRNRNRILFLDTDTIVLDDISQVFNVDLGGKAMAAVRDVIMRAFVIRGALSMTTGQPSKEYLCDYLGLNEAWLNYFQAGVTLFDLDKFRDLNLSKKMISDLRSTRYWFLDQDVLNKHLAGNVLYLDYKWNCVGVPNDWARDLPADISNGYEHSKECPSIIHYAGAVKPWDDPSSFFAYYYWHYLRMTAWYERVLISACRANGKTPFGQGVQRNKEKPFVRKIASKVWRAMPQFIRRPLFPLACYVVAKLNGGEKK